MTGYRFFLLRLIGLKHWPKTIRDVTKTEQTLERNKSVFRMAFPQFKALIKHRVHIDCLLMVYSHLN